MIFRRVIFPAKQKENLDWESIDKLCNQNPDFKDFLKSIGSIFAES